MPTKIFVGNLSANIRSEDVRILFEKYGKVTECDVLKNFGFVHMMDEMEADTAITELDGYSIKGSRMRVEKSTGKSTRGRGTGDRRGGGRGRGGSRGAGRGDRYPGSRYDPYSRPPAYDYYDRRYPPPPRDDRRLPPPEDDRYGRDRYGYERRAPPPGEYDRYDRRPPPPDPYYRDRGEISRPPPDYYARRDPYYAAYPDPGYPDARGPPPPKPQYEDANYPNGYGDAPPPPTQGQNYYDRFYKTPPAKTDGSESLELTTPGQGFLQSQPIYF